MQTYAKKHTHIFFIQIGSNDGITCDPIHRYITKYHWRGILVEPVDYLFNKLRQVYKQHNNLLFENSAIADKNGFKKFYRIRENSDPRNPFWYDQLGSFQKHIVLTHRAAIPNFDKHLITERVRCITYAHLLHKYAVQKIDLLSIDTEGYDFEIIKQIVIATIKPRIVCYEHKHLNKSDKTDCINLLLSHGYFHVQEEENSFAYLPTWKHRIWKLCSTAVTRLHNNI